MKALAVGGLIACLGCFPASATECVALPSPPHPPDGATASREEMLTAMHAIRDYEASVKGFQDCAAHTSSDVDKQAANMAIDRLVVVAGAFNNALNAFKKKSTE